MTEFVTSNIAVTEGNGGKRAATYEITETDVVDGEEVERVKQLQRITENNPQGEAYTREIPKPVEMPGRSIGESREFFGLTASGEYIPICVNAFTTGRSLWIQGKRKLGKINVTKPSSDGVVCVVTSNYYVSGGGPTIATIDCSKVGSYDLDVIGYQGLFVVMADPGGGTPPSITFSVE